MSGLLGNNYYSALRVPTSVFTSSGSRVNHPLSSLYTHGTSGPSVALRYQARSATPITEFYVLLDDIAGTLGNITMGCILYNEHASSATQPGTTARATASAVTIPSAVDKWIKVTFGTPYTPTVGEVLWFVLRNTSPAPTVDYPMLLVTTNLVTTLNSLQSLNASGFTTTTGFSTAGTAQSRMPFVVVHGSEVYGNPYTQQNVTTFPSSTIMRGFQLRPPVDIEISGWLILAGAAPLNGLRIYDAAVAPGGSPLYTFALGSTTNQVKDELIGAKVFAPIILTGGTLYNVVATYGSAATQTVGAIEDYASFPTLFDAMTDSFIACPCVSDNGGAWLLTKSASPTMQLLVSDFPPPALSGIRRPKIWNGSVWQEKPMGVWNGSVWEEQPIKVWNGSAWV